MKFFTCFSPLTYSCHLISHVKADDRLSEKKYLPIEFHFISFPFHEIKKKRKESEYKLDLYVRRRRIFLEGIFLDFLLIIFFFISMLHFRLTLNRHLFISFLTHPPSGKDKKQKNNCKTLY